MEKLVAACCVLHNYLRIRNDATYLPPGSVDAICGDGDGARGHWRGDAPQWQQAPPTACRNSTVVASEARVSLTQYFSNEGALPWQDDYIRKST